MNLNCLDSNFHQPKYPAIQLHCQYPAGKLCSYNLVQTLRETQHALSYPISICDLSSGYGRTLANQKL